MLAPSRSATLRHFYCTAVIDYRSSKLRVCRNQSYPPKLRLSLRELAFPGALGFGVKNYCGDDQRTVEDLSPYLALSWCSNTLKFYRSAEITSGEIQEILDLAEHSTEARHVV